ncbi:hypothetical protein vseg_004990 [Gypsophila vaccaria]
MAGFFSPGNNPNNRTPEHEHEHETQPSSSYYYNNSNNNSELWSQQMIYHHNQLSGPTPSGDETARSDEEYAARVTMMRQVSGGDERSISCQDCGNQAKKDCPHMRCRTCCKSRGFDCATHVKSTWVPASVRRLRSSSTSQQQQQQQQQVGFGDESQAHFGHFKRPRDSYKPTTSSSNTNVNLPVVVAAATSSSPSSLPVTSTGMELGNFPAEVSTPAVFRCVRVSSIDDTEDEVAYQTAVNIGGHVFKGILYDQGPDHQPQGGGISRGRGESSSGGGGPLLNLTARPATSTAGIINASSSLGLGYLDPALYPAPFSPYMHPGTQFFPNPRP